MKRNYNNELPPGTKYLRIQTPPYKVEADSIVYYYGVNFRVGKNKKWMSAIVPTEVAEYWVNVRGAQISPKVPFINVDNYKMTGPA